MPLGKQHELEADLVGGLQQFHAVVELRVEPAGRQRRQGFGDGLGGFRRADGRHRDRCVDSELHGALLLLLTCCGRAPA